MKFIRCDGTSGEFEPLQFPRVESKPAQEEIAGLAALERDVVAGEAGRQVAAAMFEWLKQRPSDVRCPKEQV